MNRIIHIAFLVFLAISVLTTPLHAGDFGPIFPAQGAQMVSPPNLTWATGDKDFFVLVLLAPIPGYWYQPIAIPLAKSYFLLPESWWDAMMTNSWGLWAVLGMNTTTWDYGITPWQFFQKVTNCVVIFPDPDLEGVIRDAIGKPAGALLASDLVGLTALVSRRYISDMTGLEYCTNLTELELINNQISNIYPVAGLVNLKSLTLWRNNVADISPLAGLTALEFLWLDQNPINELDPLVGLWNLTFLGLSGGQVSDVSSLAGLTGLKGLYLGNNQISDLSPLAGLTALLSLLLYENQISDLGPLVGLTELEGLDLGGNQISDISPLAVLPALQYLYLTGNQIADLSPLASAELSYLHHLYLAGNQVSDIYALVENTAYGFHGELNLRDNELSTTSCTVYIPELQSRGIWVQHDCYYGLSQ